MKNIFLIPCFCLFASLAQSQKTMSVWDDVANWKWANDTAKYKGVVMGYFINDSVMVDNSGKTIGYLHSNETTEDDHHKHLSSYTGKNRAFLIWIFLSEPEWDHRLEYRYKEEVDRYVKNHPDWGKEKE